MPRAHRYILRSLLALLILWRTPIAPAQPEPAPISDWARETIQLPPGFAPEMPSGAEELRFPPGWRDPDSENFWSYAIVLRLHEPVPAAERLGRLIDIYYTGLMDAFGVGRKPDAPPNEVEVDLTPTANHQYEGVMRLVDGFATHKPIAINIKASVRPHAAAHAQHQSVIELRVSPKPDDHAIWARLQSAIDAINAQHPPHPLSALAHLPGGEWRTTPNNGYQQRDVWAWGPSKHALTSITTNSKATSESIFGSFRVIYHHPQRDELTVLALSAPGLIQIGTLAPLKGLDLRFDMTLYYDQEATAWVPQLTRTISSVWSFDAPTSYTNHWIKDQGQPVAPSMTGWSYAKHTDTTPRPASANQPPKRITRLAPFLPLLESQWETDATRLTLTWIPYNEAILMRTLDTRSGDTVSETIIYPHPHTKAIHTLTIHDSGAIDEGTASAQGDAIVIKARRADAQGAARIEQRIEPAGPDAIRVRAWSIQGPQRTPIADATLSAATH